MTTTCKDSPSPDRREATPDQLEIRCPRLGGQVPLTYCLKEGGTLPCQRIVTCWQGRFPVAAFLQSVLTEDDWHRWTNQSPKEKVTTLLELIEAARERLQSEKDLTGHPQGEES